MQGTLAKAVAQQPWAIRYDISPLLSPRTAVFPGDISFTRQSQLAFERGDHLALSSMRTTLHVGAHADAPNHYHPSGTGIHARDLQRYLGWCQVVDVRFQADGTTPLAPDVCLQPDDVRLPIPCAPRILFRTNTFPNPNQWTDHFAALSPGLLAKLAQAGVQLVGVDTPSIDPATSKSLAAHQTVFEHDMAILEGLVLTDVPAGDYTLIALPLPLEDADASPVRAVLLDPPQEMS